MATASPTRAKPLAVLLALAAMLAPASNAASCSDADRDALLTIRAALSVDDGNLGVFSTWTPSTDCCTTWYGVGCDPTSGRVSLLSLRGESDDAVMAPAGNPTSGVMSGYVSDAVCRLDRLSTLVLADWKRITGPLPSCLAASSLPSLRVLELPGNRLTGEIPPEIGTLSRLAVLNLADNQLTGAIPGSLTSLTSLKHLDLADNRLTGGVPSDIGKLTMLSRLLLARNRLTGPVPPSVATMPRLADLDLSENRLTGSVPPTLGSSRVLASLYLGANRLAGRVPASLLRGGSGLGILNLSRNALDGAVPDAFTPRSYFTLLDLSRNRLTGTVPRSLAAAAYVGHLDLSHNRMCGTIPDGKPFDHLDAASFASNSCLCGGPLGKCT